MGKKERKVNLEETNQHMLDEEEYSALLCARKSPEVVSAAITNSGFCCEKTNLDLVDSPRGFRQEPDETVTAAVWVKTEQQS